MKTIINLRKIIKDLQRHNLTINDEKQLMSFLFNCNYNTLIDGYSQPFIINHKSNLYDKDASSDQIIAFYEFDMYLANRLLNNILKIEKKLNTNIAYSLINAYSIEDRCLLKLSPKFIKDNILVNINQVNPKTTSEEMIHKLCKYLASNEFTKKYEIKRIDNLIQKWSEIPLDVMCLSWSFSTTFSLFISLDERIQSFIIETFNVKNDNCSGFIDFLKNIIHLRNMISHNYVIYSSSVRHQSNAFNKLFYDIFKIQVRKIEFFDLLKLIEYFTKDHNLINEIIEKFAITKINTKFKKNIILFGRKELN